MSYFTETFESILEFKGDIAAGYAERRNAEADTHIHGYGKTASEYAKDRAMNPIGTKNGNVYKDMKEYSKKHGTGIKDEYKSYNSNQKSRAEFTHRDLDNRRNDAKTKHESFDPVYEDLCRMGIID